MPKVRQTAADMVRRGFTPTQVGRRFGVGSSTVCKWVKKARRYGYHPIPTRSSRPAHHPRTLSEDMVRCIIAKRLLLKRSAEVVQRALADEGIKVSLSSVKRTLDRRGLLKKRSHLKRWHAPIERPRPERPGDLVQIDTVHLSTKDGRIYVFTGLDVYSRFAYAKAYATASCRSAVLFVREAQKVAPFTFALLQSDHGTEFSQHFTEHVHIAHRHSRVRRPNDNAHLERFNRTLQEECLDKLPRDVGSINRALPAYLRYYNEQRHHFGLNLLTPVQKLQQSVQGID